MFLNFLWSNLKALIDTLLTSYKPLSTDFFSSHNRRFSHFSIWSFYKVGRRQVAQYLSRLALSIVFKISFFRVQWASNIFCQLLKRGLTWISKTPQILPPTDRVKVGGGASPLWGGGFSCRGFLEGTGKHMFFRKGNDFFGSFTSPAGGHQKSPQQGMHPFLK